MIEDQRDNGNITKIVGYASRIRVIEVKKGVKKSDLLVYHNRIENLDWDPHRLHWDNNKAFMDYTSNLG